MSKNDDLQKKLAAARQAAVNDDPHGQKKLAKKKTPTKAPSPRRVLTDKKEQGRGREKMTATVSPAAVEALRAIELFLINECGERRMNTSAAIDVALQLAGENLKGNKGHIQEIIAGLAVTDKRRRTA